MVNQNAKPNPEEIIRELETKLSVDQAQHDRLILMSREVAGLVQQNEAILRGFIDKLIYVISDESERRAIAQALHFSIASAIMVQEEKRLQQIQECIDGIREIANKS